MEATNRAYEDSRDYGRVISFLQQAYLADPHFPGWKAQRFEDMEYRLDAMYRAWGSAPWHDCIHLWEEEGRIVGLCVGEKPGENFCYAKAGYQRLYPEMVQWTRKNMCAEQAEGRVCTLWAYENQPELICLLEAQGFSKKPVNIYLMECVLNDLPEYVLPDGFTVVFGDMVKDEALKTNVSHWGFNPDREGVADPAIAAANKSRMRAPMFDARYEVMVESPQGELCCYAYLWVDHVTHSALVEPASTREKFRRLGLGRAMLLAGLARCREAGVTRVYVEPYDDWRRDFYSSAGFEAYGLLGIWSLVEQL